VTVFRFTQDELVNIRRTVRFLIKRYRSGSRLAAAIGTSSDSIYKVSQRRAFISPSVVFRIAHLARVSVDDIVSGRWPPPSVCHLCGQPSPPPKPRSGVS
jgi:hypothetical protein